MLKYFRKADFVLLVFLLVVGIAASVYISMSSEAGDKVVIRTHGETFGTYSLMEDRTIEVKQGSQLNTVSIESGTVTMHSASCKNQVCVEHVPISRTGESIICLPNQVVVTIDGKEDGFDAVTK